MASADPKVREVSAEDHHRLARLLAEFEQAWDPDALAAQLEVLPPAGHPLRALILPGLVKIDLRLRWSRGDHRSVEDYLRQLPELGGLDDAPADLIHEEYLAALACGAGPDLNEYARRFPKQADALRLLVQTPGSPGGEPMPLSPALRPNTSIHGHAPESDVNLPEQFGRYRIIKKLGQGGMGAVYLAHDSKLDRRVALKVPRFAPDQDAENLQRFYREARATATIQHPNLCPLYDVGEFQGRPYLTMAYIEGASLARYVRPDKPLPQYTVATVVRVVAAAVAEAHKRGIVHRDLKPSNIMINTRGEPIVMDFGLARWVNADKDDTRLTRNGAILGAPVYMSPEQVYGDVAAMGPGCDVYSLGVILYELLTGRLPFEGPTTAVLAKTLIQEPTRPSRHRLDLDPALEAICLKAMAKQIQDRYATMADFAAALTEWIRSARQQQGKGDSGSLSGSGRGSASGPLAMPSSGNLDAEANKPSKPSWNSTVVQVPAAKPQQSPQTIAEPRPAPPAPPVAPSAAIRPRPEPPPFRIPPPSRTVWPWVVFPVVLLIIGGLIAGVLYVYAPPAEGLIQISLDPYPKNAEILIDGAPVGGLGSKLPLAVGKHSLRITGPDIEPVDQWFQVQSGENPPLRVQIQLRVNRGGPVPVALAPFQGHAGAVKAVAIAGNRAVSAGADGTARVWSLDSQREERVLAGHTQPVLAVSVSRDGKRALTGSADKTARLWDLNNGGQIRALNGHNAQVRAVALTPDGRWAVTCSDDRSVRQWNADNGQEVRQLTGHNGVVFCVAASADGKFALTGGEDHTARLWDLGNGKEVKSFIGHTEAVTAAAFSPDGKRVVTGSDDRTIRVWDARNGKELKTLVGHAGRLRGVAFTPEGNRVVSAAAGDGDDTVRVWEASNGKGLFLLGRHNAALNGLALTGDGRGVLVAAESDRLLPYDMNQPSKEGWPAPPLKVGVERLRFGAPGHGMDRVAVSPDGKRALTGGMDGTVRLWDLATGTELRVFKGHGKGTVHCVAFSPDGKRAASASDDRTARVWDLEGDEPPHVLKGHGARVWGVAFSPDGQRVLTGSGDKTARLWDAESGAELTKFEGHTEDINAVAFAPDGLRVVTASWDGTARLWDANNGAELREFPLNPKGRVQTVAFAPDGKRFATGNGDKSVRLWDATSGKELHRFDGHTNSVYIVAFSPGGRCLASCGADKTVCLWDVEGGQLLARYVGHTAQTTGVAFTVDGCRLLSVSADQTLRLWDLPRQAFDPPPLPSGREVKGEVARLDGHRGGVENVVLTPDGKRALSASHDGTVGVWDLETRKELFSLKGHTAPVHGVDVTPDGKRGVSAGWDNAVIYWDLEKGQAIRTLSGHTGQAQSVVFSPNGKGCLSGASDNTMRLWNLETGQQLRQFAGHTGPVWSVAFLPGGDRAVSGSFDGTVRLWDVDEGRELSCWALGSAIHALAVSPDGRRLAAGGKARQVFYLEVEGGRTLGAFNGHTDTIPGVAFSPDGRWILSCGDDKTMRLWDVETGREAGRWLARRQAILSVAFTPDGRRAVTGDRDGGVCLWDLPAATAAVPQGQLRVFEVGLPEMDRVAVSPNGRALLAGYDNSVRLWDLEQGKEVLNLQGHTGSVRSVSFAPDGRRGVSGSNDGTARIWDLEDGREIHRLQGHTGTVWCALFSPDGKRVLTTGQDGNAAVWDAVEGKRLRLLEGHVGLINGAAWSPDGRLVLTGGGDKTVRLWNAETGQELKRLEGHTAPVATLAFSPDGHRAASGAQDRNVRVWDLDGGACLYSFEGLPGAVWAVAFDSDGRRLLVSGGAATVNLWDVVDRQLLQAFVGHKGQVPGVAFLPDHRRFVSASKDKTVRVWGLPPR
jgi:WD40 repeat protein/serine/threonine protein kinase